MPTPRKAQVSLSDTPYYHCISRCVRRAFLCGRDKLSGKSYEHRRGWVEQRLTLLGQIFAIDICAYAVMSNHTHIVLHVDKDLALSWTTVEVLRRWHRLHRGTVLTRKYTSEYERSHLSAEEVNTVEAIAAIYRQRLYDISWFMRVLNEFIARRANKEDECTGRFWEGRFKSQALLDEASLAACMAYVDLNPVRSQIASAPESSQYTSIKKRITAAKHHTQPESLFPLAISTQQRPDKGLPFTVKDYIQLVKQASGYIKSGKVRVDEANASLFEKLGLTQAQWLWLAGEVETKFASKVSVSLCKRKWRA